MNAEEFFVEEVIHLEEAPGDFLYVKVMKQNRNTLDVVHELTKQLHLPRNYISFAGTKDKNATTTQYMSIYKCNAAALQHVVIDQVKMEVVGRGKKPIVLGALEGNTFRIKRDLAKIVDPGFMVNYFGPQRFSTDNVAIGRAIVRKQWDVACVRITHPKVQEHLAAHPKDYIGALQRLDKRLLSLYVNAFQAFLWNCVAAAYLREVYDEIFIKGDLCFVKVMKQDVMIPLLAFDTTFQDARIEQLYQGLLKQEGLSLQDFILRSFPDCLPIAVDRPLFVQVKALRYEQGWLHFFLLKGSYATVLLQQLESFL